MTIAEHLEAYQYHNHNARRMLNKLVMGKRNDTDTWWNYTVESKLANKHYRIYKMMMTKERKKIHPEWYQEGEII